MRGKYPILLTYLIDHLGLAIVFPIFTPLVLSRHFTLFFSTTDLQKTYMLAIVIIAFPIAQFFGAPLIGSASDKIGRKKVFIITVLGTSLGYFIIGMGTVWDELSVLILGRAWTGFFAGNLTLCLSALSDMSRDDKTKTENFSLLATAGGLSFIIAVLIAESLFDISPSVPFWFTSALSLINLFLILIFFKETCSGLKKDEPHLFHGVKHILSVFKQKNLRNIYLIYFFFTLSWIPTLQFLPLNISRSFGVPSEFQRMAFIGLGVLWSLTNLLLNPFLHRRQPNYKILLCTLPLLSLALITTHFLGSLSVFLTVFAFAIMAGALNWTNILLMLSNAAPPNIQGEILGMNQSVGAIATVVGLSITGFISLHNPHYVFLFSACAPIVAWCLLKTMNRSFNSNN